MPELDRSTWLLIGAAVAVAIVLIVVVATRRGRKQVEREAQIRRSQTVRVALVVILLALMVGFAVANSHDVEIDWIFTDTRAPMVLVIALSGGLGLLAGLLVSTRSKSD